MLKRLGRILTSKPVIGGVAAVLLYLALGFLALPALLHWQLPKQVSERLQHRLQIGALRFNPLNFRLEADDVALSDAAGRPMFGLRRLQLDFELRSLRDHAWTFSLLRLEAPQLRLERQDGDRHNFSDLLDRLAGDTPAEPAAAGDELPRFVLLRGELVEGRFEFFDRQLADPRVTRVESFALSVDRLGAVDGGRFQFAAHTADGETLDADGRLLVGGPAADGQLALKGLRVSTLSRALARWLRIDAPAGTLDLALRFKLGLADGAPAGTLHDIDVNGQQISIGVAGSKTPLFAARSLVLDKASVDLGRREMLLAGLVLADGVVAASVDAAGRPNWDRMGVAQSDVAAATPPAAAAAAAPAASAWRIGVPQARVSGLRMVFADASADRRLHVDQVDGELSAQIGSGPAGLSVAAEEPSLTLAGLRLEQAAQALAAPALVLRAGRARLDVAQALDLVFDAPRIDLPKGLTLTLPDGSAAIAATSLQAGQLVLKLAGARLDAHVETPHLQGQRVTWQGGAGTPPTTGSAELAAWSLRAQRLALGQDGSRLKASLDAPRARTGQTAWRSPDGEAALASLTLQAGQIQIDQVGQRVEAVTEALRVDAKGMGWRAAGEELKLAQATLAGDRWLAASTGNGFEAEAVQASVALTGLGFQQAGAGSTLAQGVAGGTALTLAQAKLVSDRLGASGKGGAIEAHAAQALATLSGLGFRQDDASIELAQISAAGASLSFGQAGGRSRVEGRGAELGATGLVAGQGADRLALQEARLEAGNWRTVLPPAADAGAGLEAEAGGALLQLTALELRALGATSALARLGGARVEARKLQLDLAAGAPDVRGEGLGAELTTLRVQDPADAAEWLRLASATLAGGALNLQQRSASAERLVLSDGSVRGWLDGQGRLNWNALGGTAAPVQDRPATPAPWSLALAELQVDTVALDFEDRRESPAFALGLDLVEARVNGFDTTSAQAAKLEFDARFASGGELGAQGTVAADGSRADLQLRVEALALAPLQPFLERFAALRIAGGTASAEGRLRHGDAAGAGASLVYEGGVSVLGLKLDETAAERVFLSWESLATGDLVLNLGPDRVDIGELRIAKPSGRLIIAEDQSINLTDVLKRPDEEPDAPIADGAQPAEAQTGEPFALSIARLRIADGALDFADLSLRPQFRARMHELKGVINGLTTDPERAAGVQLEAQVDRFGQAKISGQLSLLRPEQLTDIEMAFRNLEMSSLSPYIAKFAGYRIAGGRLALDLRYQVRERKLKGENRIVLKQLELGERVESPDAIDLPLELAVAILKDADGVIDVGLPVSGDLGDPQFDIGALVGKAIGGLLGGIVTAPFRALGAIFGSGGEKALDSIDFAPGRSALAPPERGKLDTIARALQARPKLKLTVQAAYDADLDRPALQSLAVRSEIVRRIGGQLAEGDDPGTLDVANPRVQRAIEAALGARYAPEVIDALKRRAAPVAAAAPAASAASAPAAAPLPASFYRGLLDRMVKETAVPAPQLVALAEARARVIVAELTGVGGVAPPRVVFGQGQAAGQAVAGGERTVRLTLELGAVE